jgi:hypothetical protein
MRSDATIASAAIRTRRSPCSSTSETRDAIASSPGKRSRTRSRKRALISRMISRWRGSSAPNSGSGQVSSASGISVWLVYETASRVTAHAAFHSMPYSSISRRISSAGAIAGWVSFRWIALRRPRSASEPPSRRWRATRSCSDALTRKASCFKRSTRPASVLSSG